MPPAPATEIGNAGVAYNAQAPHLEQTTRHDVPPPRPGNAPPDTVADQGFAGRTPCYGRRLIAYMA